MNIISNEDYLHEVSNPIFWINNNHFIACWISPESDKFWGKFNKYHQFIAAELAQRVEKIKG